VDPAPDWSIYRRLKAEGRLNLLLRLSEPTAMKVSGVLNSADGVRNNVLPFVCRADHLAWRKVWQQGRFVRLSWPPDERAALLRQDELFRRADTEWAERHGPVEGGGEIVRFPRGDV
jgi:hypothetical protein